MGCASSVKVIMNVKLKRVSDSEVEVGIDKKPRLSGIIKFHCKVSLPHDKVKTQIKHNNNYLYWTNKNSPVYFLS